MTHPYLGTHSEVTEIFQSPDVMIFVNGDPFVTTCLECKTRVHVKDYVTSITTSASLDGSGNGTASFELSIPRHANIGMLKDGKFSIPNMAEVEIFFKGSFTINGMPRYYRSFWGFVSQVSESYSDGNHSISVSCQEMLAWWNLIKFNMHPSLIASRVSGKQSPDVWVSRFKKSNPFQILAFLSVMSSLDAVEIRNFNNEFLQSEEGQSYFRMSSDQMIQYWTERMGKISKSIRVYGTDARSIFDAAVFYSGDKTVKKSMGSQLALAGTSQKILGVDIDTQDQHFTPFAALTGINLFESDYKGRVDIMVQVKDHIGWEFYQDTNGEIVFKPPFFNVDVKQNFPVSWIRNIDTISDSYEESPPEATRVDVVGEMNPIFQSNIDVSVLPTGVYQDPHLVRQYGIRHEEVQAHWLKTGEACGFYAVDKVSRYAAKRFSGQVTIPGRPEMRLGFPVYIERKDSYYYVNSISHSYSPGGSFTTSLGLTGKRSKFSSTEYAQFQNLTIKGKQYILDANGVCKDNQGRNLGIPYAIMRPMTQDEHADLLTQQSGKALTVGVIGADGEPVAVKRTSGFYDYVSSKESAQIDHDDQRRGITWAMGGYWVYDVDPSISSLVWRPNDRPAPTSFYDKGEGAIPLSDASGYELIGAFPYGRGLYISDTGEVLGSGVTSSNEPISDEVVKSQADRAAQLRNMVPDDMVEATESVSARSSIGGGSLSTASVLKIDQTNDSLLFVDMKPDHEDVNLCYCSDNYTLDSVLLLTALSESLSSVFSGLNSMEDLFNNPYRVTLQDTIDYESIKRSTQSLSSDGSYVLSPSVKESDI